MLLYPVIFTVLLYVLLLIPYRLPRLLDKWMLESLALLGIMMALLSAIFVPEIRWWGVFVIILCIVPLLSPRVKRKA